MVGAPTIDAVHLILTSRYVKTVLFYKYLLKQKRRIKNYDTYEVSGSKRVDYGWAVLDQSVSKCETKSRFIGA